MVKKQLYGITIFRFVAAFYVFIFHMNIRERITSIPFISAFISNGAIGMSIFFVLSGFILTYNYSSGTPDNYIRKRIARIYPAYMFMGLLCLPFIIYEKPLTAIGSIAIFVIPIQAWFYQTFYIWNFGGSWSVSVEIFFYLLFPIILTMVTSRNKGLVLILSLLASSCIVPIAKVLGGVYTFPVYYITPIYRLPEFIFGVALGRYFQEGFTIKIKYVALSGLVAMTFTLLINPGYMFWNIFILPFIGALMLYLARLDVKRESFARPFIYLGEVSYSFYLMQLPILLLLDHKITPLSGHVLMDIPALFLVNLIMACVSYHFIESNKSIRVLITSRSIN